MSSIENDPVYLQGMIDTYESFISEALSFDRLVTHPVLDSLECIQEVAVEVGIPNSTIDRMISLALDRLNLSAEDKLSIVPLAGRC